jgi:hypothetical protein
MYSRDHTAILTVDPPVVFPGPVPATMRCRKADTSGVGLVTDTRREARHPGPRNHAGNRGGDMPAVVSRERATATWLTGVVGLVILAAAFVMMACAAPSLASPRPHGATTRPVINIANVSTSSLITGSRSASGAGRAGQGRRAAGQAERSR